MSEAVSWWRNKAGELRPRRAGITLAVRALPALTDGFVEALTLARERGLIGNAEGSDGRGMA
jgi:hypothetical protein